MRARITALILQELEAAVWLGLLEVHDPDAVHLGRKPKIVTVDGVKYEV